MTLKGMTLQEIDVHLLAHFLLDCLLKVLTVHDGANFPFTVRGPVRGDDFHCRIANIPSVKTQKEKLEKCNKIERDCIAL